MRYLLDTNICIYTMKRHPPEVRARLGALPIGEVGISGIVLAELRYGTCKGQRRQANEAALADFLAFCRALDWPQRAASEWGDPRRVGAARTNHREQRPADRGACIASRRDAGRAVRASVGHGTGEPNDGSGFHGHNRNKDNPASPVAKSTLIKPAYEILDKHDASVLLSGHDHHFEQFARQDVDGNRTDDGIRAFIVGTGGGAPYLQNIDIEYTTRADNQEHIIPDKFGILRLELYSAGYSWDFVPTEGSPIVPSVHEDACNAG